MAGGLGKLKYGVTDVNELFGRGLSILSAALGDSTTRGDSALGDSISSFLAMTFGDRLWTRDDLDVWSPFKLLISTTAGRLITRDQM